MKPGRLRAVRWTDMAIVFQGALHTLNPVQRVGRQIAEAIELHDPSGRGGRRVTRAWASCWSWSGCPARRARRLPAPAVGRPAPARDDRARARLRPAAADRRRADDRARRDGAGPGAAAARRPAARARAGGDLHHPRPLGAGHGLPSGWRSCTRGGSSRRGRRGGVRGARAPVHARAGRGVPGDRRPGVPDGARRAWPATRPTRASCPSGCPFHPRCAVAVGVRARPTSSCGPRAPGWRAACVHVRREGVGGVSDRAAARAARHAGRVPRAARASRAPSTASTSTIGRARWSRWSASRAAARRRWRARSSGLQRPARARSASTASRCLRRRALRELSAQGADGLPGPDRRAQPAPDDLRDRGRRTAHPAACRGDEERLVAERARARRPAPARAVLPAVSARAVRRPTPAGRHRRRDGARARACWWPTSRCRASTPRCAARSSR